MKKILSLFVLCSFLAVGVTANACDGHKKASKASTEVAKTPVTTASTAVAKDAKKECTPAEKAACTPAQKAACGTEGVKTTSTDATGAAKAKGCCSSAKKTMAKKS